MKPGLVRSSVLLICLSLACAPLGARPHRAAAQGIKAAPGETGLEFHFLGTRLAQTLYWKIDTHGRGEISTPEHLGHNTDFEPGQDYGYFIKGGVHRFDIGRRGYAELRGLLAFALPGGSGLGDPGTDAPCWPSRSLDLPALELRWSGKPGGSFVLTRDCRTARRDELASRMVASWRVIARRMIGKGDPAAMRYRPAPLSVPAPLPPPIPLTLDYQQRSAWTGWTLAWHLETDGKGWLELSEGANMQLSEAGVIPGSTRWVAKGRHPFDIGPSGYSRIRSAFEPYISGPQRTADCEGPTMTDQPLMRLAYTNPARAIRGETSKDLGCADLAQRAGLAERTILAALPGG